MQQAIRVAMLDAGGFNVDNMWGAPWDNAWKRNDPIRQVSRIVANGTRLWIYCAPGGTTPLDVNADPNQSFSANSLESMALKSNLDFRSAYEKAGGNNRRLSSFRPREITRGRTGERSCKPSNQT